VVEVDQAGDEFSVCLLTPLLPEPEPLMDVSEQNLLGFEPDLIPLRRLVPDAVPPGREKPQA
jgi:hypothetical protein